MKRAPKARPPLGAHMRAEMVKTTRELRCRPGDAEQEAIRWIVGAALAGAWCKIDPDSWDSWRVNGWVAGSLRLVACALDNRALYSAHQRVAIGAAVSLGMLADQFELQALRYYAR